MVWIAEEVALLVCLHAQETPTRRRYKAYNASLPPGWTEHVDNNGMSLSLTTPQSFMKLSDLARPIPRPILLLQHQQARVIVEASARPGASKRFLRVFNCERPTAEAAQEFVEIANYWRCCRVSRGHHSHILSVVSL